MAGEVLAMIESDLAETVESDFGTPVSLIDPQGNIINTSVYGGPLYGRYTDDYIQQGGNGEQIIVPDPMLLLRISSLSRVPERSENWGVLVNGKQYVLDGGTKAPERADSIGYIRLFPRKVAQA